ncbi:hypothetical protein [Oerskovia flava]|uniref:hypothetical protein n=1 Tax=Oerskovia flava TaxID=2986422 RepID=UPI0022405FE7|nr:hypothetical protein [Oerskovia sp. JB1-3-2]
MEVHVLMASRRSVLAPCLAGVAAALLAACLPVLPEQQPVGLRVDGGVISAVIPSCPGDAVLRAVVTPADPNIELQAAWSAEELLTDASGVVVLDRTSWRTVRGDYSGLAVFGVDVETESTGFGVPVDDPDSLRDLPPDHFWVGGEIMSAEQFRAMIAADFPCEA